MNGNLSASAKFWGHTCRMAVFGASFTSAVLVMAYAITSLIGAWPKVNVAFNLGDDIRDAAADEYDSPREAGPMHPGGSELDGGIIDSLAQYGRYNEVLQRVSIATGLGKRMARESLKDKEILNSHHDDWDDSESKPYYSADADPATMSREVTLFNF